MPHSRPNLKPELFEMLQRHVPIDTPIVDIGAGDGSTGVKLKHLGYSAVDAIEAHWPWIQKYKLSDIYDIVFCENAVRSGPLWATWKIGICTDMLEHLTVEDAQSMIEDMLFYRLKVFFIVPWNTPQGAYQGVEWERHRQPDLTPMVMKKRYPQLELLKDDGEKGLYLLA